MMKRIIISNEAGVDDIRALELVSKLISFGKDEDGDYGILNVKKKVNDEFTEEIIIDHKQNKESDKFTIINRKIIISHE